jgi:hypothetical protein
MIRHRIFVAMAALAVPCAGPCQPGWVIRKAVVRPEALRRITG